MRAVDTNVLVRLWTRDDEDQLKAAEQFIEPGAWVPLLAVAEAVWVLSTVYGRSPQELAGAVEMLIHHNLLVLQDAEVVEAALHRFRAKPSLGFSDCLILETARKAGHLPLGTFDAGFAKVEGAVKITGHS